MSSNSNYRNCGSYVSMLKSSRKISWNAFAKEFKVVKYFTHGAGGAIVVLVKRKNDKKLSVLKFYVKSCRANDNSLSGRAFRETMALCNVQGAKEKNPFFPTLFSSGVVLPPPEKGTSKQESWKGVLTALEKSQCAVYVETEYLMGYTMLFSVNLEKKSKLQLRHLIQQLKRVRATLQQVWPSEYYQKKTQGHNDLHPKNILVKFSEKGDKAVKVKLIDFELSYTSPDTADQLDLEIVETMKDKLGYYGHNMFLLGSKVLLQFMHKYLSIGSIISLHMDIFTNHDRATLDEKYLSLLIQTVQHVLQSKS